MMGKMKISCCWLYAISKYGYPPSLEDTKKVIKEISDLGFKYFELEGVGNQGMQMIYDYREEIKEVSLENQVKVINFCPILPDIVSLDQKKRSEAFKVFKLGIEVATYFEAETIQTDSFLPPLKFRGETPYKDALKYGEQFEIEVDPDYDYNKHWEIII